MGQQIQVCTDATLHQGEKFDWVNPWDVDVDIIKCQPPLENPSYHVPKKGSAAAKVTDDAEKKRHYYECKPDKEKKKTNPHVIIIT